ncbi:MAG: hypothetical protein K2W33_15005 [Burkholderiales bacterium]|nr:hypothetical protein [Burkholderiales bacterium]
MSLSPKDIESTLNLLMQSMTEAFNLHGSCKPFVAVVRVNEARGMRLEALANGGLFFADEAGKDALSEFCRAALSSDEATTGIVGVVICHEAWVTKASPDDAAKQALPPSQSPDRQEALCAGIHLRGGQVYSHMLIAEPRTRQVQFMPYVHRAGISQIWSRFSSDAAGDDGQEDQATPSPTYH